MTKWRLLDSDTILSTQWLSLYKNKYEVRENKIIDDYYVIKRNDFVLVVAIRNDKLVLVRQYRPATDQLYLALPAGYLNHNEPPEGAAKRELLEETAYSASKCNLIGELHPLPGYIQSTAYLVLCEEISRIKAVDIDTVEINEVIEVEWGEVFEMIVRGEINEMQAVAAILLTKEFLLRRSS